MLGFSYTVYCIPVPNVKDVYEVSCVCDTLVASWQW